jgi:hypothetical protein
MMDAVLMFCVVGAVVIAMIVDVMVVVGWLRRQNPWRNR